MRIIKIIIILFVNITVFSQILTSQIDTTFYDLNYSINNFSELRLKNDTFKFSHLNCWKTDTTSLELVIENIEKFNLKTNRIYELERDSIFSQINDTLTFIFTAWANEYEILVFETKIIKIEEKRFIVKFKELKTDRFYSTTRFYSSIQMDTLKELIHKINYNGKACMVKNGVDLGKEECRFSWVNYYFIISNKCVYGFWQREVNRNSKLFQEIFKLFRIDEHLKK